jgi:hypothetical protein
LKTIKTRHHNVQQNQVGGETLGKVDRFEAIAGSSHHLKA